MKEHGVYVCSWSRSSKGYTLWVKSRPRVRASGVTYAEAEQRLIEAIHDVGGALQAVMEFDPPLPKSTLEERYGTPEIYLIGGDDRFETDAPRWKWSETAQQREERCRWLDAFYDRPVCRKCKFTSGRRNGKAVTLTYAPSKYDGAFGSLGTDGGPRHELVSEEFLTVLTAKERRRLKLQPTVRKRGRTFFELVGPEGPPYIAPVGVPIKGWRCTQCNHRTWGSWVPGMSINSFVAGSDLSARASGVFTVGTFPEIQLAVTGSRSRELLGQRGTRGFASRQLGVVSDSEVVRDPELPTYEERLAERSPPAR
jgi:hypothetical protein